MSKFSGKATFFEIEFNNQDKSLKSIELNKDNKKLETIQYTI